MKAQDLKRHILDTLQDTEFRYRGEDCLINPHSAHDIYLGYKDIDKTYTDIDDLMNDPVFDGKSLNEIVGQIELI